MSKRDFNCVDRLFDFALVSGEPERTRKYNYVTKGHAL